jgi:hypothetical protein
MIPAQEVVKPIFETQMTYTHGAKVLYNTTHNQVEGIYLGYTFRTLMEQELLFRGDFISSRYISGLLGRTFTKIPKNFRWIKSSFKDRNYVGIFYSSAFKLKDYRDYINKHSATQNRVISAVGTDGFFFFIPQKLL